MAQNKRPTLSMLRLSERMTLHPTQANVRVSTSSAQHSQHPAAISFGIDMDSDSNTPVLALPFTHFVAAEEPIPMELPALPYEQATYDTEVATITYKPDPADGAVMALVHAIHTADGTIYDVSLPTPTTPSDAFSFATTPADTTHATTQQFAVRQLLTMPPPSNAPEGNFSFGVLDDVRDSVHDSIKTVRHNVTHVLHMVKAPIDSSLRNAIARTEQPPRVFQIDRHGNPIAPLDNHHAWRSLFPSRPSHRPYRVLCFIHGFGSSIDVLPRTLFRDMACAPIYHALLAYDHPTITRDPVQNARELLAMVPDDIHLLVDLVVHSRGGLVARSLVELLPRTSSFQIERMLTCGSPHGGSPLAERERWDRLVSIGMTATSCLTTATGGVVGLFVPTVIEYILHAASQFLFDLPGLQAMAPNSLFLQQLNALQDNALWQQVTYGVATSRFDPATMQQQHISDALMQMSVQAFMGSDNDLVVPTTSMSSIDPQHNPLSHEHSYHTNVNHFSYFADAGLNYFANMFLGSGR